LREVTVVLDDDIGKRLYRPIKRPMTRQGKPLNVTDGMVRLIINTIDKSPEGWGPERIHEAIRRGRRHDVSHDLIRNVIEAMQPSEMPVHRRP
jgi:hypothetical protein